MRECYRKRAVAASCLRLRAGSLTAPCSSLLVGHRYLSWNQHPPGAHRAPAPPRTDVPARFTGQRADLSDAAGACAMAGGGRPIRVSADPAYRRFWSWRIRAARRRAGDLPSALSGTLAGRGLGHAAGRRRAVAAVTQRYQPGRGVDWWWRCSVQQHASAGRSPAQRAARRAQPGGAPSHAAWRRNTGDPPATGTFHQGLRGLSRLHGETVAGQL